ncbi:MAG: hypothetical protein KKF56_02960 [Nanoarchaeota archaeon]|nr:hypothetical protein [Nanoarchaeota archaeon]
MKFREVSKSEIRKRIQELNKMQMEDFNIYREENIKKLKEILGEDR